MIFVCTLCGKEHPATEQDLPVELDPAEREKLRAAWLKADDWANAHPRDEKARASAERASLAYFSAIRGTGVWKLPATITTVHRPDGWRFQCAPACEA